MIRCRMHFPSRARGHIFALQRHRAWIRLVLPMRTSRAIRRIAIVPLLSWLPVAASPAAEIAGSVRDARSLEPLPYANVIVVGAAYGTAVKSDGTFLIEELSEGTYELLAFSVGYERHSRSVTVPGDSTVDFLLERQGAALRRSFADSIGSAVAGSGAKLACEIVSEQPRYRVGEHPRLHVWIRNEGDCTVSLPLSLDGSPGGIRFPIAAIEFSGGVTSPERVWCANTNALLASDFVRLEPGAEFDPYSSGRIPPSLADGVFTKSGRYTVTFHYSTDSGDITEWLGFPNQGVTRELAARLKNTPRVVLECAVQVDVVD